MRFALILSLVALATTGGSALAEFGNPGGLAAGTPMLKPGVPAPHQPNDADRVFSIVAAVGGLAEVELGKLAEEKAARDETKSFARRMIEEHGKANARLASLAKADNIALPYDLDPTHKQMLDGLQGLTGVNFDIEYLRGQVADHQKTAQLMEYVIDSGQDADIVAFAKDTLPVVIIHLTMAQDALGKAQRESLSATSK